MSDNIKVVVKVRPLITRELEEKLPYQWRVHNNTLQQLDSNGRDYGQTFTFDKVYNEATETTDVYKDVAQPIVEAATAGINGTIFAYGQTSSGKTYTMTGTPESPGIIPLSVLNLFNIIKNIPDRDFLVRVSYIEIYNETLIDLLDVKNKTLKIKETYEGIKVDAFEKVTSSTEDVLDVMREGEANRQTGATAMNEKSSRSHSIFQITIESRGHVEGEGEAGCVNVSQLNLVDLAGSERAGQTGATGKRFIEGTHINKSLSALALVIKQLSENPNKFANYRDSKLTRILQNSLGGNAKTSIICAITPAALEETISTLQFATRAKAIKNKPEVNAVATDATMIQTLTKQLSRLQSQLESKKNLEVMLETKINAEQDLQKQIANLQKVILNSFVQRQNIEQLGGTRRKLQPPRRITISTLHSIEDDPVPTIPKFCTPSLKYNPMSIPNPSDFLPISNSNKLATLPEEPARLVTPPPIEKKVNFENDVIEIDSDDDNKSTNCSPYHKCYYSTSKTPPCILREKLNRAEKEYKGILEFTEMEKMYTPDVVELMKKLQQSTNMATEFQEELEILKKNSKEKELEIDHLKIKIKKSEEEVSKSKLELETYRKEYNTKLTDWEVSYETLKKKAKLREEELLSFLAEQEQKAKKCEDIGKLPAEPPDKIPISLMNMKDISLVNSDDESSIITPSEEESSEHIKDLVASLQDQLIEKCQTIVQLEANLASQKHSIEFLEQSSNEIQGLVDSLREKVVYTENENGLLQSTVSTLNATITDLQKNLELAQNDMASYNTVIQELQTKLTKKDNLLNMHISDSVLETMIANEEKVIANNENMKNIIHSFKTALDSRNKEIEQLRLSTQEWNDSQIRTIIEDRDYKTKQVEILNEEMVKLNNQAKENINTINNLMREKSNLASVEQDLTKKVALIEVQKTELEELKKDSNLRIDKLKETNEKLLYSLSETKSKEEQYVKLINELKDTIDNNTRNIIQIQEEIITKDNLISTLRKENSAKEEYEHQAKLSIDKIKSIISTLSGDVLEIPELLNNFVTLFNALSTGLSTLELVAMDTMSEKNTVLEENKRLKSDISDIHSKYDMESTTLKGEIEKIRKSLEINLTENAKLLETNDKLSEDISKLEKEIKIKRNEYEDLLLQYISCKDAENNLRDELLHKHEMISAFNEKEATYTIKIRELESKLSEVTLTLKSEHDQLQVKDETLAKASNTIEELKGQLKHNCEEVTMAKQRCTFLAQENVQLMQNICRKLTDVLNNLNITNDFACNDIIEYSYEHILRILDKISCEFKSIGIQKDHIENQLCESKKQTDFLNDDNEKVRVKLCKIENENKALLAEVEKKHVDGKQINENLVISNELLEHLKQDLECKASEIEGITKTAQQWKEQFINLDILMKQQMQNLQHENEELHARYQKLKNDTRLQIDILSKETCDLDTPMTTISNNKNNVHTSTPPSLLTICCNKIVEVIEPKSNDYTLGTKCCSNSEKHNIANINNCDTCDQLSLELRIIQEEKSSLLNISEQLEKANENLIAEQDKVRQEVKFLVVQAQELQKKIANHKTNLSILTATTYTENRSLKSQVKGLQHHHSRFHNVCQRDIPELKRQLHELVMILKDDPTIFEIQSINQKRYSLPDVLDNNSTVCNFKNESVLDGDVLMLDTNVTITTTGDNTLVGYDHTCLDQTQTDLCNDVSCPINDPNQYVLSESDRQNMLLQLEVLKKENVKLKASIESKMDAQCSPIKQSNLNENMQNVNCQIQVENPTDLDTREEIKDITQKLTVLQYEKDNIEKKYNDLVLEMPDIDALVSKLNVLEKEYDMKVNEVSKLTCLLDIKNKELKTYQEENDSLSTQVMENISEADDLSKQLDIIKIQNHELTEKILKLELQNDITKCSQCQSKDEVISFKYKTSPRAKLNRSLSDSDTSSRNNKICTLQSEIYAGREDCKVLTEDVATIKQHLDCSNISMDLDDSMGDSNSFSQALDFTENIKCNMPDIQEEPSMDIYALDKVDCINYYLDITGLDSDHVSSDKKIIDIMKMLYNNLITKHGNEVENLLNKLRNIEESQNKLQSHVNDMAFKYSNVKKTMEKNENDLNTVSKFISNIKSNVNRINDGLTSPKDKEALAEIINKFKNNFLNTLDFEFGVSSINIFEVIVDKYHGDLSSIEKHCITLQNKTENLNAELEVVTDNLAQLKTKLAENESAYNLLNAQKEKILEISNAVTLDIVRKEKEMLKVISENCQKLFERNLITTDDLSMIEPAGSNINLLFDRVISQHKKHEIEKKDEHKSLSIEVEKSKTMLDDKEKELAELKIQIQTLKDINNNVTIDLTDSENKVQKLKAAHDTLSKAYDNKSQENVNNINLIGQLTEEITCLKEKLSHSEKMHAMSSTELVASITKIEEDNKNLRTMNQRILMEKEAFCQDLEKSTETIKSNIVEIKKMTADILELKDSLDNSTSTINLLKQKAHTLTMENAEIKQSLDEKNQSYITLEKNIKTLEKTVEMQSAIIKRINKQKEEHDIAIAQKLAEINELTEKLSKSRNDCDELMKTKELLEARVTELQAAADKPRLSLDTSAEGSRRRRQSVHDCKRPLEDLDEHKNLEAVFSSRQKPDDLFMDIDGEDTSGRSTPMGLGRGRDSLLSNTHQSDKDEEHSSRPSSVLAIRRRRQSIHDMNRAVARHTPSPHDVSNRLTDDVHSVKDTSGNRGDTSEVNQLREKLVSCQQELEDLKERYRELDEECETCAEYLRERDEQCLRLKKEKAALEKQVNELKSCPNTSQQMQSKPGVSHVAVNTDEDWANLHAVVVDRMSYDAEVEKSKRLTKCIEELRFKQQDLKNTIAKMHMSLEKHSSKDVRELDATKSKLKAVQQELEELKVKYKELDEECETCSEYLKEREEQCRRLKEAKAALERKVEELLEDGHAHALAHSHSVRKKRQTVHDSNRESTVDQADASTEISDDLASYQAEGDDSTHKATDTKRLKMTIQLLTNQKMALEKQLKTQAMPSLHPMYVATGSAIVQNQQLTDVMKENQKLKKLNAKLVNYYKKRSKCDANRENEDPCEQG